MLRQHGFDLLQSEFTLCLKGLNLRMPFEVKKEEDFIKFKKYVEDISLYRKIIYGVKCQLHNQKRLLDLINLCIKTRPTSN